jgi:hypothetical protein
MPDFRTIGSFRKDNGLAIRSVCRQFIVLYRQLDLFSQAVVAVDDSEFKAVNNRDWDFHQRQGATASYAAAIRRAIEALRQTWLARTFSEPRHFLDCIDCLLRRHPCRVELFNALFDQRCHKFLNAEFSRSIECVLTLDSTARKYHRRKRRGERVCVPHNGCFVCIGLALIVSQGQGGQAWVLL